MKELRKSRKAGIRLGKVRRGSSMIPRVGADSRQLLGSFSPRSQRVVVKVKQSYSGKSGSWRMHGRYLERDVARSGDGFSQTEDSVRVAKTLDSWQKQGDEKLHKIILSPEYSERLDLRAYAREVMRQMEQDLQRPLEWVAVIHRNTNNHHAHISVRGVDREGKRLDIENYLGESLRERSRELITKKLGPRLYPEIIKRRESELFVRRATDIDRAILWKADNHSIVTIPEQESVIWHANRSREQQRIRLAFLAELGLARKISNTTWSLSPEIRQSLKQLGLREQIIREQVPGWEFVRTLQNAGVVRKQLALGESLTARVIAVGIRDPFGDRRFMMLEGSDGVIYHMNEPRGVVDGETRADQVITLTRRLATIRSETTRQASQIEFSAVDIHHDWKKSLALDYDAAASLRESFTKTSDSKRVGFAKAWESARLERAAWLRQLNFDSRNPNWKRELEKVRFAEVEAEARNWNPREHIEKANERPSRDRTPRLILGEVCAVSEARVLAKDVRSGAAWIVEMKDIGLDWPPRVGGMVRMEVKPLPRLDLRPADERIASILSSSSTLNAQMLTENERKFILSRVRTWMKWKILRESEQGSYEVIRSKGAVPEREQILTAMTAKLDELRNTLTEKARKQPAWLKALRQSELERPATEFGSLEALLRDAGPVPERAQISWLSKMLRDRQDIWERRGVKVDKHFEKNAKAWLKAESPKDLLKEILRDLDKDRSREQGRER